MNIQFGLFFCTIGLIYAEELTHLKNGWHIENYYVDNKYSEGWILQASKENVTKQLYFSSRRTEIVQETENCIIIQDVGIAHSSSSIFVVYFSQHQPYVIYQSPELDISTETKTDLLQAYELKQSLVMRIKIFNKRCPDSSLIIKNIININGNDNKQENENTVHE